MELIFFLQVHHICNFFSDIIFVADPSFTHWSGKCANRLLSTSGLPLLTKHMKVLSCPLGQVLNSWDMKYISFFQVLTEFHALYVQRLGLCNRQLEFLVVQKELDSFKTSKWPRWPHTLRSTLELMESGHSFVVLRILVMEYLLAWSILVLSPKNPSFVSMSGQAKPPPTSFEGICRSGDRFPPDSCNGKIVGARLFARAGQASGEFNATIHYASPYDPDGHGRCVLLSYYCRSIIHHVEVFFNLKELPTDWNNVYTAIDRSWQFPYTSNIQRLQLWVCKPSGMALGAWWENNPCSILQMLKANPKRGNS